MIRLPDTIKGLMLGSGTTMYGIVDGRVYPRIHLGGRRQTLAELDSNNDLCDILENYKEACDEAQQS